MVYGEFGTDRAKVIYFRTWKARDREINDLLRSRSPAWSSTFAIQFMDTVYRRVLGIIDTKIH